MRVTADTNIWVSATISSRGAPARLEAAFRAGRFALVTSAPLLDEMEGVLRRPRLAIRFGVTPEKVDALLALLRERAEIVAIPGTLRVCRDPDDDAVIETAIEGNVDVLVSGDDDIRLDPAVVRLLQEHGVEVWSIRQFGEWLDDTGSGVNG